MNPYPYNYAAQNQRVQYPNYGSGPVSNPIQVPINNSNQIIQQYSSHQLGSMNQIPSVYNPVNIMPPQINLTNQQQNIRVSPPNPSNLNIIQPQYLNQNTSNIIYNQNPKINTNLINIKQNQISILNNYIPNNPVINSNQKIFQEKYNQVNPLNINQINSGYNLNESKIINNLINNSMIKNRKNEAMHGHPPIPIKYSIEVMKSICKISYDYKNKKTFGTGFFMKYSDSLKLLITNYHVIFPELINNNIQIEIWNNKKIILNLKGRYIKFLEDKRDITDIEIKTTDEIYKDIKFLNYDLNYHHNGYNIYNDAFIFSIEHPLGQDASSASGKIINIDKFEFDHDIDTDYGSSGSPIILLNNLIMVIGIHKNTDNKNVNGGTFIGEIINEINKDLNFNKPINIINNNDNYIIGEIYIKDEDVNKKIRIINS